MITILPAQSKQKYVLGLLKDQAIIGDTNFVSLSVHLNSLSEHNRHETWFKCAALLRELSQDPNIKVLKDILRFPITVDQVSAFVQRMADEGWILGDLPCESDKEKELYYVLDKVIPLYKDLFIQWNKFESSDFSQIEVLENFYDYPINQRLRNVKHIEIQEKENVLEKCHFASNPRSEVQAAIQYILKDECAYSDQSLVCLDSTMMDQAEVFLKNYGIDYQKVDGGFRHPALKCFESIVKFKHEASLENFIEMIHNDVFDVKYKFELIKYLTVFKPELSALESELTHVQGVIKNQALISKLVNSRQFVQLEVHAESALSELRWIITELKEESLSAQQFVSSCFNVYANCLNTDDEDQLSSLYTVKEFLESSQIQAFEAWIEYLLFALDKLKLKAKNTSGLILTDLKHSLIPGLKRQIWLGCTQQNYPQVNIDTGLFDQAYCLKIKGYDLNERYRYHMVQLDKIRQSSDEIIYSYSIGSYDGKAQKMPYELEKALEKNKIKAESWRLIETESDEMPTERKLASELSQALFIQDELKGSISSFESYTHCPYQYFLKYGLGLKEVEAFELSSALLGNISHAFLENAIKEKDRSYALMSEFEIKDRLLPYLNAVKALYPNAQEELLSIEYKLIASLKLSLEFLKDWEAQKDHVPSQLEEKFDDVFELNNNHRIHLVGKIDRIDESKDAFSVIDYKSSDKSFKEHYFMKGLQLQLATYLWAHAKKQKKASFAGYFSQKPVRVPLLNQDEDTEEKDRLKLRRLKGLSLEEDITLDKTQAHIVGWIAKKEGMRIDGKPFVFEKVMTHLKQIYTDIYIGLEAGDIKKQNIDHSCQYCPFKHFCQYGESETKIKYFYPKDSVLRRTDNED